MAIKSIPRDFIVEEIPSDRFVIRPEPGPFAVYQLHKAGIDTPSACKFLARWLKLPSQAIVPAGLKDKHATTKQLVTVRLPKSRGFSAPAHVAEATWSAARLGWADQEIDSSAIDGNRFEITIRRLTREACDLMDQRATVLAAGPGPKVGGKHLPSRTIRFVNYFGAQRFGANRHGQGYAAKQLCLGQPEAAMKLLLATPSNKDNRLLKDFKTRVQQNWGRWDRALAGLPTLPETEVVRFLKQNPTEFTKAFSKLPYFIQQINVEAYQSYLWNMTAVVLIEEGCNGRLIEGNDEFTPMVFPEVYNTPAELAGLVLPLLSPKTQIGGIWGPAAIAVLEHEGLQQEQLKIPGLHRPFFGESPRSLFVDAQAVELGRPEPDETADRKIGGKLKRRVVFELPRGAYATVLLRALGQ